MKDVKKAGDKVVDFVKDPVGGVKDAVASAKDAAGGIYKDVIEGIEDIIERAWNRFTKWLGDSWDKVSGAVKKGVENQRIRVRNKYNASWFAKNLGAIASTSVIATIGLKFFRSWWLR